MRVIPHQLAQDVTHDKTRFNVTNLSNLSKLETIFPWFVDEGFDVSKTFKFQRTNRQFAEGRIVFESRKGFTKCSSTTSARDSSNQE